MAHTMLQELVVISGKGGTGKTSIVASFAALAQNKTLVDCDVDASDLHLILEPNIIRKEDFSGGKSASIIPEKCMGCGKCAEVCRFDAVKLDGPPNDLIGKTYRIDDISCEGCGVCAYFCPTEAIDFSPSINGEWYFSETRFGPMVHARLGIAQENSGKLVTLIKQQAKQAASEKGHRLVIVDGSPGIGCPVIASLSGASLALVVVEPTLSGIHDMERVVSLTRHFGIPVTICINKCDINPEMSETVARYCRQNGISLSGEIRFDPDVTSAQIAAMAVVEYSDGTASKDIQALWKTILQTLEQLKTQ